MCEKDKNNVDDLKNYIRNVKEEGGRELEEFKSYNLKNGDERVKRT